MMILRLFVLLSACVCLAGRANAVPVFRLQPSSPLLTVQSQDGNRDVWRSPEHSLQSFPFLAPEDCNRYGRRIGYSECRDRPLEKGASAAKDMPEPPSPRKPDLVGLPVPLQAPLPVRRTEILDDKTVPAIWSAGATLEEPGVTADAPSQDRLAKSVGALLVVGFEGRSAADEGAKQVANALRQGRIGGVLLRRANIESAAQLKALTAFFSRSQDRSPLILVEHSGGPEDALAGADGFQSVASPREIGAQGDALEAFDIYRNMAANLAIAGVSLNIGPSATACPHDASAGTINCFGPDPRHSAAFANAFNFAHQSKGVLTAMRYQVVAGDDGTVAFAEIAKRKAPDMLVVSAQNANGRPSTNTLRPAGYSGTILLDRGTRQDAAEELIGALNQGADMVLFRTPSGLEAGLSDADLAKIRSATDVGRLAQDRLDNAEKQTASLRRQLQDSRSSIASRATSADQDIPTR